MFRNHYHHLDCPKQPGVEWIDTWDCACNDQCPACGTKDIEPYNSEEIPEARTHAGLCLIVRQGLTRAYNVVLEVGEHPRAPGMLDQLEKSIDALDKLERAYNAAGLMGEVRG